MQSMDEQPTNEPTRREPLTRESQEERNSLPARAEEQPADAERTMGFRGASEQIPFWYPPTPAPYQSSQTPPTYTASSSEPSPVGPAWSYPPQPGLYQRGGAFTDLQGPSSSQQAAPFRLPTEGVAQPGWVPGAQPGLPERSTPVRPQRSGLRTGALIALVLVLALVFGVGLFAGWQFGRANGTTLSPSSFQTSSNSTAPIPQLTGNNADAVREAVINKVQPGIVQVNVTSTSQQALGSGVIIDRRGYIVTNNHVVSGANSIQVTLANNTVLPAQVVGTDAADDLAVIKITPPASGLTTVTLGDSSQLRVGQGVLAIGSPLGNAESVTSGIVSALNRNVSEGQNGPVLPDAIQTDAPINPGNSGGALVDMQGNLIGMPTLNAINTEFNTPANGLGFAIPVNRIHFIAQQIVANGHVAHTGRAILGVTVTNVNASVAAKNNLSVTSGALVVNTSAGGPAESAGMKAGDVIVQLENVVINSTNDVSMALLQKKPGDTVAAKVYRGGQQLTLNVSLGELPVG